MARQTPTAKKKPVARKTTRVSKPKQVQKSWLSVQLRKRRVQASLFVLAFAIVGTTMLLVSHAATPAGQIVGIANKCIDDYYGRRTNGNPVTLWTCNSINNMLAQRWTNVTDSKGITVLKHGSSNFCLDVQWGGRSRGTPVQLWTCNNTGAQQWILKAIPGLAGYYTLTNPQSNMCLDDKYSGTSNGNTLWIWTCNGGAAQKWRVPVSGVVEPPTPTPTPTPTPVPEPTPPPTPGTELPSGEAMPVGDLPGWKQVFTDNFLVNVGEGRWPAGEADKWQAYGGRDTSGHGQYEPGKVVTVGSGIMNVHVHTDNGTHLVATSVPIVPGALSGPWQGDMQYGRYAVRFRADPVHGYKTAFLLWPRSENWPHDGELDFPEGNLDATIGGAVHYQNGTSGDDQTYFSTKTTYNGWHTAVIEWTPQAVTYYIDKVVVSRVTNRVPNTPMHWVMQIETALDGTSPRNPDPGGNVQIDWVSIYKYAP